MTHIELTKRAAVWLESQVAQAQAKYSSEPYRRITMPTGEVNSATTAVAGSGLPSLYQTGATSGHDASDTSLQNGCAVYNPNTVLEAPGYGQGIVRLLSGAQRIILPASTNPTLTRLGPQEYVCVLSLSGTSTVQLNPQQANSQQTPIIATSPLVITNSSFTYTSRQIHVATVSNTGLVMATGRGETILLIGAVRQVSSSISGSAVSPAGNTGNEVYLEIRIVVTA